MQALPEKSPCSADIDDTMEEFVLKLLNAEQNPVTVRWLLERYTKRILSVAGNIVSNSLASISAEL